MSEGTLPQESDSGVGGKRNKCWKIKACASAHVLVKLPSDRVSYPASERS
jgi:hypothetical protein